MTVRVYKSTDTSAPVLTGVAGSLVALLDAVLVNGYGSMTAAGWTKPYNATNKGSYRMVTSGNTGFYLDVNDAAPTTAKEAQMRGYEVMTASATGTNPFPTVAQSSFGAICRKSTSADSVARPWFIVADGSCLYIFIDTGDYTSPNYSMGFMFGDIFSYTSGDAYRCVCIGRGTENSALDNYENLPLIQQTATTLSNALTMHYIARTWTGTGASIGFSKHASLLAASTGGSFTTGSTSAQVTYPNGPDSGLELSPIWVAHNAAVRGYLKGLWAPLHYQPLGHGDIFSGTGNMSGKSFLALNIRSSAGSATPGQIVVETSDTWS